MCLRRSENLVIRVPPSDWKREEKMVTIKLTMNRPMGET